MIMGSMTSARFLAGTANSIASRHNLASTESHTQLELGAVLELGALLAVNRPMREIDSQPPSDAKVNDAWSFSLIAPIYLSSISLK